MICFTSVNATKNWNQQTSYSRQSMPLGEANWR